MAKIPTYTSRAAAASTSGIPRASGIPFRDFTSPGIIEAGKQIGAIADQLLKSAEDDAVGQAKLNATLKFNDLQTELQTMDPMQAISSFDDRANAILEEAGGGLSSNAASRFRNAMRREFASKKIAVQKDGITRGRQKLEANLVSRMAGLASSAQATDNDTIYQQRADEARQAIDEAIANRVVAADVGERYYQNYLKDADSARASFDMQRDPDDFVENIKSGEYLPSLTGEQRAKLQKQGNEILERRARKEVTKQKAEETKIIKNATTAIKIVQNGGSYDDVAASLDPDMLRAKIKDPDVAKQIIDLTQDAVESAETLNGLRDRSEAEITEILSTSQADANNATVSLDQQLQNQEQLKRTQTAAAKIIKARQDDAGQEALRNDAVRETFSDFRSAFMGSDGETAARAYSNYADARDSEYDRLGISIEDRRLLPNSMAEEETEIFKSGNVTPEQAGERMKLLRQTMGDDWPMALNEMQKFKMPRSAAKLMMVDDDNIRTRMIRGDRDGGVSEVTKRYGIKENDFNKIIAQTTQKFITAADKVGFAMAGGIQDAVKSVAVDMMVYGKESSPQAAIKEAYDLVVTKQYAVVNETKLRGIVPKENYGDRSSIRLDAGLNHWFKENSDFVFHKNNQKEFLPGVTSGDAQKIMLDLVQQNGMWQLAPDGSAAELHVNGSRAFDAEGRAVRVSLDEAMNLYDRALDARRSTSTGSRRMGGQAQ